MSETRFTPGEWVVVGSDFDGFDIYAEGPTPDELGDHIAEIDHEDRTDIHNAHLIAAAPDLYEALEALATEIEEYRYSLGSTAARALDNAGLALQKARGEA